MNIYESLGQPLLFSLDPEFAHDLAKKSLRYRWPWSLVAPKPYDARLAVNLAGLNLSNPICLSPGFDKNAEALSGLQELGLGAIRVGSILPYERPGNPKPRLLRYPSEMSLGNCYGLPSDGLDACA